MKIVGSRIFARALGLGLAALLASCGNSDSGTAQVRVINASQDSVYASLDFVSDGVDIIQGVGANAASAYVGVSAGTHTTSFNVIATDGTSTAVQTQDRTVAGATTYTVVDYGFSGALKTFQIAENVTAPAAGTADLRIINTATDAGAVDVYVTPVGGSLANVTPQFVNVAGDNLSGFLALPAATYQVVVTGTGNVADVRLVIPSIALTSQEVANLMVTPTSSGVLVSGLLAIQGGAVTNYPNQLTRYRLVASLPGNATVDVSVNGVELSSGALRSPLVNATYTGVTVTGSAIPATATLPLTVNINGVATTANVSSIVATAGQDISLLVTGTADAPIITALVDDNRLPTTLGDFKLRVVNAISGTVNGTPVDVSLALNFTPLANSVAPLTESAYSLEPATTSNEIDVNSLVDQSAIFSRSNVTLLTAGVYSVFVLGDASAPIGTLIKDR